MKKLSDSQVRWIVRAKVHVTGSSDIARALENVISVRRIEQLYVEYEETGQIPTFGNLGRAKVEIPAEERAAVRYA